MIRTASNYIYFTICKRSFKNLFTNHVIFFSKSIVEMEVLVILSSEDDFFAHIFLYNILIQKNFKLSRD